MGADAGLAWIVEKFREWTDSAQPPEEAAGRDRLLTNVMLYWLTGTAGRSPVSPTSVRTTRVGPPSQAGPQLPLRHKADRTENIVRWTGFDRGGHCAAMEEPDLLVDGVRAFFRQLREKG